MLHTKHKVNTDTLMRYIDNCYKNGVKVNIDVHRYTYFS